MATNHPHNHDLFAGDAASKITSGAGDCQPDGWRISPQVSPAFQIPPFPHHKNCTPHVYTSSSSYFPQYSTLTISIVRAFTLFLLLSPLSQDAFQELQLDLLDARPDQDPLQERRARLRRLQEDSGLPERLTRAAGLPTSSRPMHCIIIRTITIIITIIVTIKIICITTITTRRKETVRL